MNNLVKRPPGCLLGGGCLTIFGAAFAGFFSLGLLGLMLEDAKEQSLGIWVFMVLSILIGLSGVYWGFRQRRKNILHANIVDIVTNQGHRSVEAIGMILGETDLKNASKKIQAVLNKGYLPGYSLDPQTNRLTRYDPENPPVIQDPWPLTFECSACGAKNRTMTIDGTANCEYCGSPYVEKDEIVIIND